MTPKEKAIELINKYMEIDLQPFSEYGNYIEKDAAKKIALIAVDEMMLVLPFTDSNKSLNEYAIHMQKYLELVRHEIKKL